MTDQHDRKTISSGRCIAGVAPFTALVLALSIAIACGSSPPPQVALSEAWPDKPGQYREVHREWTRRAVLRTHDQQVVEAYATYKSPAWRAAYVAHSARTHKLSPDSQKALQEEQSKAAAASHEVHLLVTTWDRNENDLHKGEKSVWRLVLADDRGGEVAPVSIERDRRPFYVVRAEYPDLGDFAVPYVARFPRQISLLRGDARQFSLTMASTRGAIEFVWQGADNPGTGQD
ncbi:MAG: hypothetical protein MJE77_07970 [Proteobacteria bacterium]|nr:hypothetical protein [Pseudomonadota bacterium]